MSEIFDYPPLIVQEEYTAIKTNIHLCNPTNWYLILSLYNVKFKQSKTCTQQLFMMTLSVKVIGDAGTDITTKWAMWTDITSI